ncbi:MAG: hypothetical protein RR450_04770 [Oscillospiraceae bacterium]
MSYIDMFKAAAAPEVETDLRRELEAIRTLVTQRPKTYRHERPITISGAGTPPGSMDEKGKWVEGDGFVGMACLPCGGITERVQLSVLGLEPKDKVAYEIEIEAPNGEMTTRRFISAKSSLHVNMTVTIRSGSRMKVFAKTIKDVDGTDAKGRIELVAFGLVMRVDGTVMYLDEIHPDENDDVVSV